MTGLYATIAVQSALLHRVQTGKGQHIDLSLMDVQVSALSAVAMSYLVSGEVPILRDRRAEGERRDRVNLKIER